MGDLKKLPVKKREEKEDIVDTFLVCRTLCHACSYESVAIISSAWRDFEWECDHCEEKVTTFEPVSMTTFFNFVKAGDFDFDEES
jgi:hypothetical protein